MQVPRLQATVTKLEQERDTANAELVQALATTSELRKQLDAAGGAEADVAELQQQVDLAMEMLGERNVKARPPLSDKWHCRCH